MRTGKLKFQFKYYPVLDGQKIGESHWAAQAAECANEQGKFWEYHDKLFIKWLGENVGMYQKAYLKRYAADLKLNQSAFNACLDSDKSAPVVQADIAEGSRLRVAGTPTFFINGKSVQVQSLEFEEFQRVLSPYFQ